VALLELVTVGLTAGAVSNDVGFRPFRPLDAAAYALLAVSAGTMLGPRRWRWAEFLIALAAAVAYASLGYSTKSPYFVGLLAAGFTAVEPARWRRTALLAAVSIVGFVIAGLVSSQPAAFGLLAVAALVIGQVAAELKARDARRAQQLHDEAARLQVAEERLRIARELHDVVSHSIAMISVQAGVAAHVIDENPEQAREALRAIKVASKEAMHDLRGILGVLRQMDEVEPLAPAPGLGQLEGLAEAMTRAGLRVSTAVTGPARPLPPAVDLTGFRVVQESLTNVLRHAHGAGAQVMVSYEPERVLLEIIDDGPPSASAAGTNGHGIQGMRERVAAVGGELEAGPRPLGGFRVRASLPAPLIPE
jgi:signal transduction histidine kinase